MATTPPVQQIPFGKTPEGDTATLFILTNNSGVSAAFTNWGAAWVRWITPDRTGKFDDIILGFDNVESYVKHTAYFGAVCGRHANRIADGKFYLDGRLYQLAVNNGPNHLHGGTRGFDRHLWDATVNDAENAVTFRRTSPAGEEKFPGTVQVSATYTLLEDGTVRIDYAAESDTPTPLNLTNHAYFNLAGHASDTCLDHTVALEAQYYLPINKNTIPTGAILPVAGTLFDFLQPTPVSTHIDDPALAADRGYDTTFILEGSPGMLRPAAQVSCPRSGRILNVDTTEPTIHLYTGNWLNECAGDIPGKGGAVYKNRAGLALETQHAPDAVNKAGFRANILRPGVVYTSTTQFRIRAE